jgi:hypothetical protein
MYNTECRLMLRTTTKKEDDSEDRLRAAHADAIVRATVVREVAHEDIGHVADGALGA